MNTELLLRVKAAILAEPESFDMDWYFEGSTDADCGTAACIAGWAVTLKLKCKNPLEGMNASYQKETHTFGLAVSALKIQVGSAYSLFHLDKWPSEFANRYKRAKTPRGRAKVAADRIDYFIETKGK